MSLYCKNICKDVREKNIFTDLSGDHGALGGGAQLRHEASDLAALLPGDEVAVLHRHLHQPAHLHNTRVSTR